MNRTLFHLLLAGAIFLMSANVFAQQSGDGLTDKQKDCILQFTFGYMVGNITTSCFKYEKKRWIYIPAGILTTMLAGWFVEAGHPHKEWDEWRWTVVGGTLGTVIRW
jgi:uncharacterized PurR-regulated membrane protein YhhQ (DUF165 family)